MFQDLANFGLKRTGIQAVGFYIAYLVLIVVLAAVIGGITGVVTGSNSFEFGLRLGQLVAIAGSMFIAYKITSEKKIEKEFSSILMVGLGGLLAVFGGGLLGLIPAAYLSTQKGAKKPAKRKLAKKK